MKKVHITERNNLNEGLLGKAFELVANPNQADFIISQSTCMYPELMSKTIYTAIEPPRTDHRIWCYNNFDKFHTVVCHNPDPTKPNQIPLNSEDKCQFFPTNADPYPFVTREDTIIGERGVFYAGIIHVFENGPDACGGINITPLRKLLGDYFTKELPASKFMGIGWNGQTTKVDVWREDKHKQIAESKCDFVLALENTIYPNYLYEKIWDGFATDRVTLYLGDPNVAKHIPLDCFVDLRLYFDIKTKTFDVTRLGEYLKSMTQEEYDTIIHNARAFRETSHGQYRYHMDKLTNEIIERINNG